MHISYDQVPYPSLSYARSHPDHLATLATLLGLDPVPVEGCRVLELGCACGGNLLPMAYSLPGSAFMGLDASSRQIIDGQAVAAALGLGNITLKSTDILDVTPELGQFDYIIAHGVYSWVPPVVQDKVLQICNQNLAPNGVAYVSYNTYPGWHTIDIVRDAMLYHVRKLTDPQVRARQARALLDFMAEFASAENPAYGSFFQMYASSLQRGLKGTDRPHSSEGDAFLLHDELEEVNNPVYFHQFVERAADHGLQYLVEANFPSVFPGNFSPELRQALQEMLDDPTEVEQYVDFVRNRTFRQTLLCHDTVTVQQTLAPERVSGLYVTTQARPVADHPDLHTVSVEQFSSPDGATLSIDHPVSKAAMLYLAEMWPQAVLFGDLLSAAYARLDGGAEAGINSGDRARDAFVLGANLLRAYGYSSQLAGLHTYAPAVVSAVSERPIASPIARLQAQDGALVTNLWHHRVRLDPLQRHLLGRLDGTHDRAALLGDLASLTTNGVLTVQREGQPVEDSDAVRDILAQELDCHLHLLTRAALLIG